MRVHLTTPGRRLIGCKEYAEIPVSPSDLLDDDGTLRVADGVLNRYVDVDFADGRLRVRARGVSGVFALTDQVSVQVRPRFPLTNLTHMVSVCGYVPTALPAMRTYRATEQREEWMLDVVTDAFLVAVEEIEERGLLRTYRRRVEGSSYPHGRIETSATIHRYASRGIDHKLTHSWFEKTSDNPANRCVRAAAMHLHREHTSRQLIAGARERISRLGNALRLLDEVADDHRRCFLDDSLVRGAAELPEARGYYRPALNLAVAALSGHGLDLDADSGAMSVGSLLIKTEDLFEEFVRLSLQRAFESKSGLSVLDGNLEPGRRPLYEKIADEKVGTLPSHSGVSGGTRPNATPDVLLMNDDGTFPIVADVKYTNVTRHADRSELEQVMTYGVRYRSPVVLTIHPRRHNADGGLVVSGNIGDILVAQYRVDLAADDLDAEMIAMAQSLEALIAATS
ncbi:hypothetical protein O4158_10090 [Gordonia amicalis]|uniref:5-methylcytosine restriction system specificity protein McrC n=1 Tax=Gordonia amicalis TaxID=89053 RepID=UPI0022B3A4DB|nr:hypothetical protein [Gordonia amicalis]MCZ4579426.1 hypothetical protein [Gordonia amicalis]